MHPVLWDLTSVAAQRDRTVAGAEPPGPAGEPNTDHPLKDRPARSHADPFLSIGKRRERWQTES